MGLSVAAGVPEKSGDNFKNDEKKRFMNLISYIQPMVYWGLIIC